MLYLMLDKRGTEYYAKIGLAKRPKERRRACAGTGNEEMLCQSRLSQMSICRIGSTEWYEVDKRTFDHLYNCGMGALRPKQQPIHFIEEF